MEHLSLLHFLPQATTGAFLSSPTALCLKLITPFKAALQKIIAKSQTPVIYIISSKIYIFFVVPSKHSVNHRLKYGVITSSACTSKVSVKTVN